MKVIILYNKLFHYRLPVWNALAAYCDLTVAYSLGDDSVLRDIPCVFKTLYLPCKVYANRFVIQKDNIRKIVRDYDVVVAYGDIAWLKYSTLSWFSHNKIVFHTLGVSASYIKGYDQNRKWDKIRAFFYKKASSLAFYTSYPIKKYENLGIAKERMFVAPNTVYVEPSRGSMHKDSLLLIGTLYREKGIQLLLDAYLQLRNLKGLPQLFIVGNGADYNIIKDWIISNRMSELIHLEGPVYKTSEKAKYFARAIACVSPKQAGLAVLESMGYGVPFITSANAITGGEIFNIHNGEDGIIMEKESDLVNVLKDIVINPDKYLSMGLKAKDYYNNNRTINHMAEGLWQAIKYAYNH